MNYYTHHHSTSRLKMRLLRFSDAQQWEPFLQSPQATWWFPENLKPPHFTAIDWIAKQMERYEQERLGLLALIEKSTGKLIGQSGLLKQKIEGVDEIEVGYHLLPAYWKMGYAREAAAYFTQYALQVLQAPSVISLIHPENIASQKVALAIGLMCTPKVVDHNGPSTIYRSLQS